MADPTNADVLAAIRAQNPVLADIRATLNFLTSKVLLMSNVLDPITGEIAMLQAAVTSETTVAQLAQAIANQADPDAVTALVAQLHGLGTTIQTDSTALAAAVTANTPAAPAPTP